MPRMTRLIARRARPLLAGLALAALGGASLAPAPLAAAPVAAPSDDVPGITRADVAASNAKVRMAYEALVVMWEEEFARIGLRFAAPALARHRTPVRSACGVLRPGNAAYCPAGNAIYFDDVFVALQAKAAARELGTDG